MFYTGYGNYARIFFVAGKRYPYVPYLERSPYSVKVGYNVTLTYNTPWEYVLVQSNLLKIGALSIVNSIRKTSKYLSYVHLFYYPKTNQQTHVILVYIYRRTRTIFHSTTCRPFLYACGVSAIYKHQKRK
jgi:hypothetical protein